MSNPLDSLPATLALGLVLTFVMGYLVHLIGG